MYTAFYGLTTSPFALTPDPQFLYRSTNHDKCLRYLSYGLERGHGLSVLTGKMGTGKTLVLNTLMQSFEAKTHRVFLPNAPSEFLEILHYISHELSIDIPGTSKAELCINLKSFLLTCAKSHTKVVLIIDDAHTLSLDVLAEVKLLTDFEHAEEKLLHIILVGQPQLASLLKLPALTPLRQRIGFHYHLLPFASDETKGYINTRLAVAGSTDPLFTSRAMKKIWVASQGIPRVINLICDRALCVGFGEAKREIGPPIIQQVVQALDCYLPEHPLNPSTHHTRDTHGAHASGITAPRDTMPPAFSAPSPSPAGTEQGESPQRQRGSRQPHRLALVAGLASISLLGAGFVLQSSLTGGTFRAYTASPVPRPLAVVPHGPSVREPPLLPHSLGVHEPAKSVQWVRTPLFYHFPTGQPLRVSLPHLQRTPASVPVQVTLDTSDSTPLWLQFDPETWTLSGTAPPQDRGKTYHLTFRAHTADGLASVLHLVVSVRAQPRRSTPS